MKWWSGTVVSGELGCWGHGGDKETITIGILMTLGSLAERGASFVSLARENKRDDACFFEEKMTSSSDPNHQAIRSVCGSSTDCVPSRENESRCIYKCRAQSRAFIVGLIRDVI
jgi:hypothetical protein